MDGKRLIEKIKLRKVRDAAPHCEKLFDSILGKIN